MLEGVLAVVRPVVECNRKQIDNGRTYLREMVFGDPQEPHHREALSLTEQTEQLVSEVIARDGSVSTDDAQALARTVSAVMFLTMAATVNADSSTEKLVDDITAQLRAFLPF